ncbi:YdiU family protein [Arcobacter sp. LA11]|uniref:protein adenylyltransferase SelO n=1 Tax=Arcobacter sp. LA11 TaxID=1898176 RepID=UPI000934E338|nr:YdiU family protein [Arcobacter sp. LA11]
MKLDELKLNVDYFQFDESLFQKLAAQPLNNPHLVSYSKSACDLIGLDYEECEKEDFVKFINGEKVLDGSQPYSMVYAGHQFGYFVPQLGDGRAINLGSVNDWHLQTKGSGLTRYSRQGDGRAVLRSSIREFIMSEAMHSLGIPTTRALALIGSSHKVFRSYEEVETGAVVMRMSPSWIRVGTFEFFAKTKDSKKNLTQLADYVIKQSYPHLENEENRYEKMFYELVDNTAELIAKWQVYGFMHGVMNSDNMSMAGLTIDYGPYAFMDIFEKHNICNHTDVEGRYSYNNQPHIAGWNLEVLANALKDICDFEKLMSYLETFIPQHIKVYLELMNKRIGLDESLSGNSNLDLIIELLGSLESAKCDYNCFFYELTKIKSLEEVSAITDICVFREPIIKWLKEYKKVIKEQNQDFKIMQKLMKKINPKYVIKNYMLQESIDNAKEGDFKLVNDLLNIAQNPFDEHKEFERYSKPTPAEHANLRLSCSS